jgi:LmbE family N-acetylglucosaminyl deacetylase
MHFKRSYFKKAKIVLIASLFCAFVLGVNAQPKQESYVYATTEDAPILLGAAATTTTTTAPTVPAKNLTSETAITFSQGLSPNKVTDDKISTYLSVKGGGTVTLQTQEEMRGVYILWNKIPGEWSYTLSEAGATNTGANGGSSAASTHPAGRKGFLHEYISLEQGAKEFVIHVPEGGAQITDIYTFTEGVLPDWVQVWDEPCEQADLLLFSTHSDDEQLFFAGLLPYYAIERKLQVQVVYLVSHWNSTTRPHEQLDGLWSVGIRNYPVISEFIDDARSLGQKSESRETVLKRAQGVYNEADWVLFQVQQLRRFKPQVVVGHDLDGEYRHGAHILNTNALMQALEHSASAEYDPASAQAYGLWDVPKTYLHLYKENKLVMDYDTPYESMGGLTPFEMSKLGYACHDSQQWTWFTDWINVKNAAAIRTYSPREFGLYRTKVGPDTGLNDMMEHLVSYADQKAAEEARLEAERLEAERLEAERLAAEKAAEEARLEAERLEAERLAAQKAAAEKVAEEARLEAERAALRKRWMWIGIGLAAGAACAAVCSLVVWQKKKRG